MDIRIGIINTARELMFQTTQSAADIEKAIQESVGSEAGTLRLEY